MSIRHPQMFTIFERDQTEEKIGKRTWGLGGLCTPEHHLLLMRFKDIKHTLRPIFRFVH